MTTTPIILQHMTLIDGIGGAPRENAVMVLRGRHIDYVGDAAGWRPQDGEQVTTLDLTGRCVLPGLIDCHVHLAMDGPPDSRLHGDWAWTTLLMLKHAQNSLAAGVTTVRDVGGRHGLEFSVRRAIEQGLWVGPRMQLAGKLLSITSAGTEYYDGMYREADGVDEVRKAAREQLKAGADLIKVLATGAVLTPDEQPGAVQYGPDELRVAVEEARKVGKGVAAHAHALEGIRNAMEAGARTIEHGTYLHQDERVLASMAERGTFLVPTLKTSYDVLSGDRPGVPAWIREKMKAVQEDAMRSVRRAAEFGVPIAMGTDAATPYNYHEDNAMELVWMREAGLSPMQAIVASTATAACALGWDSWLGTLEPGKVADLLVVDGNPLDDLRLLTDRRNIALVFQDGQVVARPPAALPGVPEPVLAGAWICCGLPPSQTENARRLITAAKEHQPMPTGEERAETLPPSRVPTEQQQEAPALGRGLIWLMTAASGLTVANIYYCQPLLVAIAHAFGAPASSAGVIATVTQLGYALGLLLLVPLGDLLNRRYLISSAMVAVVLGLVAIALAPSLPMLAVASLVMGVASVVPQMIVPFAASLARPQERGRVVGTVMGGLLIGILLARTVSGYVGAYLGWRAMYWIAAALMALLLVTLYLALPQEPPREHISYPHLLRSMGGLLLREPVLHEVAFFGALTFGAFQALWVTLTFFLSGPPYHFHSDTIGLFGLVGVVGAVTATQVGRRADAINPRRITGLMLAIVLLSYLTFWLTGQWLWGLILGVILLDMGTQGAHISNQTRIYARPQPIHSRLNTVYMFSTFIGGSLCSALASYVWSRFGWTGVCLLGMALMLVALGTYVARSRRLGRV